MSGRDLQSDVSAASSDLFPALRYSAPIALSVCAMLSVHV